MAGDGCFLRRFDHLDLVLKLVVEPALSMQRRLMAATMVKSSP
jgi:hypothetical protein